MDDGTPRTPGLGGMLIMGLLGLAALVLTVLLILGGLAAEMSGRVRLGWQASLGSLEEVLKRYPRTDANEAARELERLTAALGIDIASRSFEGRERPTHAQMLAFRDLKRRTFGWLDAQLARSHREPDPPPDALVAFLRAHDERLQAVRRLLVDGPQPAWEMDLEKLREAPIPNLLGHMDLQKLLLLDALVQAWAGDPGGAARDLEASWRLSGALHDAPILISQLVAIAVTRMQAGVVRQLDDVPAIWKERFGRHDFRAPFLTALRFEGWTWSEAGDTSVLGGELGLAQRLTALLAGPYVRYCLADVSGRFRQGVERLARLESLCDVDLAGSEADLDIPIPRWNVIGDGVVPNLTSAVHRLARLEVDLELTVRLLELRTGGGDGRTAYESTVCPGDRWILESGTDGTRWLAFDREIAWPDTIGLVLPTEFRL